MAHFARIDDDNIVTQVIVVADAELLADGVESETKGAAFCHALLGGRWIQTSYTGRIRERFAGIGFQYDESADAFIGPQPFPSWTLDAQNEWQPPVPLPRDGAVYLWDESAMSWQVPE
jgi:hypothetical protein